jgi:hypothetical protein
MKPEQQSPYRQEQITLYAVRTALDRNIANLESIKHTLKHIEIFKQIMQVKDTCTLIMKHVAKYETEKDYPISTNSSYPKMLLHWLMMSMFCLFHIKNPQCQGQYQTAYA